uniref:TNF receptor superfamily member 25 n=1 Tax=Anser brachyrhynchus TaxID=132585 RepID=A0A8B9BE10_9AVES
PATSASRMKRHCPGAASVSVVGLGSLQPGWEQPRCDQAHGLPHTSWHGTAWACSSGRATCHPAACTGTYLKNPCSKHGNDSDCAACPDGTYHSQPNTRTKCHVCYECDHHGELASVLSNCSATSNVACGCKPGHFRSCLNEHCNEFSCSKCQLCPGRLVQRPCESCHPVLGVPPPGPTAVLTCALSPGSDTQDTLCGSCKPNFYAKGSECRPSGWAWLCGTPRCSLAGSGLQYLLLALTVPLFMGAFVIYKRRWLQHRTLVGSPLLTVPPQGCPSPTHSPSTARKSPESWALHKCLSGAALLDGGVEPSAPQEPRTARGPDSRPRSPQRCALLQGSQLYAVINAVPVRRWKEFMRVLELRDMEIELVEMEVTHFRDQQYEMLKRWCQQTSATLDRIFAALEHMELAGCAEALRQSLSAGP